MKEVKTYDALRLYSKNAISRAATLTRHARIQAALEQEALQREAVRAQVIS